MGPTDNIIKLFEKTKVTVSAQADKKMIGDALAAIKEKECRQEIAPAVWRIIMNSKFTKIAAVAVVVVGVFFIMTIPGSSGIAWADVVKQIQSFKTMQFISTTEVKGKGDNKELFEIRSRDKVYLKDPGKSRVEMMSSPTEVDSVMIRKKSKKENIRIVYQLDDHRLYHRYIDKNMDNKGSLNNDAIRAWELIEKLTSDQTRKEGTDKISGVDTVVFSTSLKEVFPIMPFTGIARVWVECDTALPVRVQFTYKDDDGVDTIMTLADIQWDIPMSDHLFKAPNGWRPIEIQKETVWLKGMKLKQGIEVSVISNDGQVIITEADIVSLSSATIAVETGRRDIQMTLVLTEEAGQRMKAYTSEHIKEKVKITFDGQYQFEPTIMNPIGKMIMVKLPSTDLTLEEFQDKYLQ